MIFLWDFEGIYQLFLYPQIIDVKADNILIPYYLHVIYIFFHLKYEQSFIIL